MLSTLSLALAVVLSGLPLPAQDQDQLVDPRVHLEGKLKTVDMPGAELTLYHELEPMQVNKISPKHSWEFPYITTGFVMTPQSKQRSLRLRVFAQYRKEGYDDPGHWVTRMLLRLYGYNLFKLGRENPEAYGKTIDTYLAFGGDAGGEQLFDVDPGDLDSGNRPRKVNTIYIYQIAEIQDPFQLCRELAHEFGHATLPGVGPFEGPEDWANGDVGERIYLNWIVNDINNGNLATADAVNASMERLNEYIKTRVQPDVTKIATYGPDRQLLAKRTEESYREYVALATYGSIVLPGKLYNKALNIAGADPLKLADALCEVGKEVTDFTVPLPTYLKGKAVYLPYSKAAISSQKSLQVKSGFNKVQTNNKPIKVAQ